MTPEDSYRELPWSPIRELIAEGLRYSRKAPTIHGLFEADITNLRKVMKERLRETGQAVSLSAYMVFCLAHTLKGYKELQAIRSGRKKLMVYDDVDVLTIVERDGAGGEKIPVGFIIRAANRKEFQDIQAELRAMQKQSPVSFEEIKNRRRLMAYPRLLRKFIMWRIFNDPKLFRKYYGTALVSSLSLFSGSRMWWGVPVTRSPVSLMPSAIYTKAVLVNGEWQNREFLTMTLSLDHNISDGAPARRFAQEFVKNLEAAYGL